MHKVATVVTAVLGLLLAGVAPAFADVDPVPGDTGAGIGVSVSTVKGGQGGGSGGGRSCTYQKANVPGNPDSELVNPPPPPTPGQQGSWYLYDCSATGNLFGTGVIWVPDGQPAVPPAVLAQEARGILHLTTQRHGGAPPCLGGDGARRRRLPMLCAPGGVDATGGLAVSPSGAAAARPPRPGR